VSETENRKGGVDRRLFLGGLGALAVAGKAGAIGETAAPGDAGGA
jgi:hypothetical protein